MGGSTPRIQPPVVQKTPKVTDPAVQETLAEAVRRKAGGRGYRNTILTRDFLSEDNAALSQTLGR